MNPLSNIEDLTAQHKKKLAEIDEKSLINQYKIWKKYNQESLVIDLNHQRKVRSLNRQQAAIPGNTKDFMKKLKIGGAIVGGLGLSAYMAKKYLANKKKSRR